MSMAIAIINMMASMLCPEDKTVLDWTGGCFLFFADAPAVCPGVISLGLLFGRGRLFVDAPITLLQCENLDGKKEKYHHRYRFITLLDIPYVSI
jgi:hypothetical protein